MQIKAIKEFDEELKEGEDNTLKLEQYDLGQINESFRKLTLLNDYEKFNQDHGILGNKQEWQEDKDYE